MIEYALYTQPVEIGEINPIGEVDDPGYRRIPYSILSGDISFPKAEGNYTVVCAAILDNGLVTNVLNFQKVSQ